MRRSTDVAATIAGELAGLGAVAAVVRTPGRVASPEASAAPVPVDAAVPFTVP